MKLKHKILKILGICFGLTVLVVVGGIIWIFAPYLRAEPKLKDETSRLQIADTKTSQIYQSGECLDNCPELTTTYKLNSVPLGQERNSVESLLSDAGYTVDNNSGGDSSVTAEKGKYSVTVGLGSNPFSDSNTDTIDDSTPITTLVLVMDYSP